MSAEPQVALLGGRDPATLVGMVSPGQLASFSGARTVILVLVGAVLAGAALFFYGVLRFQNGWDGLLMKEFAIWLIVIRTSAGALLGLVVARVTLPPVRRRTRFVILGAMCGVLVGLGELPAPGLRTGLGRS